MQTKPSVKIHKDDNGLEYTYTHDYCIVCCGIKFRDVRGKDLTYLDFVFNEYNKEYLSTPEFTIEFLAKFMVKKDSLVNKETILGRLPPALLFKLLDLYVKKVLKSPPSRDTWMNNIYYLSKNSFGSMEFYENVPITEYNQMISIHKARIDQEQREYEKIRNKK